MRLAIRLTARVVDAACWPIVVALIGPKCPLCHERHRHLVAHLHVDHFGEA